MSPKEAIEFIRQKFPFDGYMDLNIDTYLEIAKVVLRYLEAESKILDFGSGPCDVTAVIQKLGFNCSACDDLQDNWHKINNNRDKILSFAKEIGINFNVITDNFINFEKNSFDMLMMNAVLEHLHDSPRELLNNLLEFVCPNGVIFITIPNAVWIRNRVKVFFGKTNYPRFDLYYWYPEKWRGHVREYTKDDLKKICEYLNLDIIELRGFRAQTVKFPKFLRPFYKFATCFIDGWRDSWLLVAKKRVDWVPKTSLQEDEYRKVMRRSAYKY